MTNKLKDNVIFRRYEFKYLIKNSTALKIKNQVKEFMLLDSFASNLKDNSYFVRSLYFDNDEYQNFYDKADGIRSRKKFRLRTYSDKPLKDSKVFLEIKGRHLDRTFKERTQIKLKHLDLFYDKKNLMRLLDLYPDNNLIQDFTYNYYKKNIKPKVLIDYRRQPFINKFGLYFRLTFDNNLYSSKNKSLFKTNTSLPKLNTYPGLTILELKFDRSIPIWFLRIVQSQNLMRKSISKFVLGICKCNLAQETSD